MNLDLDDPFTRAIAEMVAVTVVTLILLLIVGLALQSLFGMFVALCIALAGFGYVGLLAKKLAEDYV